VGEAVLVLLRSALRLSYRGQPSPLVGIRPSPTEVGYGRRRSAGRPACFNAENSYLHQNYLVRRRLERVGGIASWAALNSPRVESSGVRFVPSTSLRVLALCCPSIPVYRSFWLASFSINGFRILERVGGIEPPTTACPATMRRVKRAHLVARIPNN